MHSNMLAGRQFRLFRFTDDAAGSLDVKTSLSPRMNEEKGLRRRFWCTWMKAEYPSDRRVGLSEDIETPGIGYDHKTWFCIDQICIDQNSTTERRRRGCPGNFKLQELCFLML